MGLTVSKGNELYPEGSKEGGDLSLQKRRAAEKAALGAIDGLGEIIKGIGKSGYNVLKLGWNGSQYITNSLANWGPTAMAENELKEFAGKGVPKVMEVVGVGATGYVAMGGILTLSIPVWNQGASYLSQYGLDMIVHNSVEGRMLGAAAIALAYTWSKYKPRKNQ